MCRGDAPAARFVDYNSPWAEYNPQTRKRALSSRVGHACCGRLWYIAMRSWGCAGRVWESLGVGYGLLAGYDDGFSVLFGLTRRDDDDGGEETNP